MDLEIERKFLVNSDRFKIDAHAKYQISQGFLSTSKNAVVRVRIRETEAFLTIKGKSNKAGTTRYEWEKSISLKEAKDLLLLSQTPAINKVRYLVDFKNHIFEVDVFQDQNQGLIVAEVELLSADEPFDKPKWLGKEVTGELKYYNVLLAQNPFKNWNQ